MIKHYSNNIQNVILMELFKATESIKIAVAWFTNDLLFQPLLMKAVMGVSVELIVNNDDINTSDSNNVKLHHLVEKGGAVRLNSSSQLMHDKFCVIDNRVVICGSYNWTNKAEQNEESISIFTDEKETVDFYIKIFKSLSDKYALYESDGHIASINSSKTKGRTSLSWFDEIYLADNRWQFFHKARIKDSIYFLSDDYSVTYPTVGFTDIKKAILNEHALVKYNGLWGIYDHKTKKVVVPIEYENLKAEQHNVYIARKNGREGLISSTGEVLLAPQYYLSPLSSINSNAAYYLCSDSHHTGLFDTISKKMALPIQYSIRESGGEGGPLEIEKNGKLGLFSPSKERIIIPVEYDEIIDTWQGYYIVRKGDYKGVISSESLLIPIGHYNEILLPVVNTFRDWYENYGCVIVKAENNYGLLDLQSGESLIKCEYHKIFQVENKPLLIVQRKILKNERMVLRSALYSLKNKEFVIPFNLSDNPNILAICPGIQCRFINSDYAIMKWHNKFGIFSFKEMQLCVPCDYDNCSVGLNRVILSLGDRNFEYNPITKSLKLL